jgi:autotransporter-associated beta strand protein
LPAAWDLLKTVFHPKKPDQLFHMTRRLFFCPLFFLSLLLAGITSLAATTVRINEVMASNGNVIADEDGDFEDWIELYNYGTEPVDLSGWGLSDSYNNPFKWTFPEGTVIGAGEYLLVWASGKDRVGWSNMLNFDFQEGEGRQVFDSTSAANSGNMVGAVDFVEVEGIHGAVNFSPSGYIELVDPVHLTGDFTLAYTFRSRRDSAYIILNSTEGFQFAFGHRTASTAALWNPTVNISLSESFPANQWSDLTLIREGSVVSLYKNGNFVGSGLWGGRLNIDRIGNMSAGGTWQGFDGNLAKITLLPYAISAEEQIDLRAGSLSERQIPYHTNFSLSSSGEEVILTSSGGTKIDELSPTSLPRNISIGRVDGEGDAWFYFDEPTPFSANSTPAFKGFLEPVEFSHQGGFYHNSFGLTLYHSTPNTTIIYTLDGSEPDINNLNGTTYFYKTQYRRFPDDSDGPLLEGNFISYLYSGPLAIDDASALPNRLAARLTSWIQGQPPTENVRKGTVVRAKAYHEDYISSPTQTESFFVWEGFSYSLPVISLTTTETHHFDYELGVNTPGVDFDLWRLNNPTAPANAPVGNYNRRGSFSEYPTNFELFLSSAQSADINQNVGFRIHGNWSRRNPARNLRLYVGPDYSSLTSFQSSILSHATLGDSSHSETFQRILLRRRGAQGGINDVFAHRLFEPVLDTMLRSQPAIKFINGEYWGITFIRDRFDEYHLANKHGLNRDNIIITYSGGFVPRSSYRQSIVAGRSDDLPLWQGFEDSILAADPSDPTFFSSVKESLDIDSYIDHLVAVIYLMNNHFEHGFWRVRERENNDVGDTRWRAYVQDFDVMNASYAGGPSGAEGRKYLERLSESIPLFNQLMANPEFRFRFINRFSDHMNSILLPSRFEGIVAEVMGSISPYLAEDRARWGYNLAPHSPINFFGLARDRTLQQRGEIVELFNLAGLPALSVDQNSSLGAGAIRLNSLVFNANGITQQHWTGTYFQDVPVELEAMPEEGYRFVGWVVTPAGEPEPLGEPEFFSTEPLISLALTADTTVEAVFEPIPLAEVPVALHVWDFEDAGSFLQPASLVAGSSLSVSPGATTEVVRNTAAQDFTTAHLRVNNPLGATLTFAVPTTGYEAITVDFLTRRSGQGAGDQTFSYTVNGSDWTEVLTYAVFDAPPQARSFDFSEVSGAADNPDFALRITFSQGSGGTAGNNRFDDFTVSGVALPETKLPPQVDPEAVPALARAVSGSPTVLDVSAWFIDPAGASLTFGATSSNASVVSAVLDGSSLTLTPNQAGEAVITVSADDGVNPAVETSFRILIYPAPFAAAGGTFSFSEWGALEPAGSFPDNMIFVQSEANDPTLSTPLNRAYSIEGDAHADDDPAFPYNATSRTRINGLGEDGIAFINTGRGRDVGAAVVALDTTGASGLRVSFTAGTVLPNNRIYGLRLQSRIGLDGSWEDVPDESDTPVEYIRNATAGHAESFLSIPLPESLEDEPLVFLRWFYYFISGSGSRAQLRLDDIVIESGDPDAATTLAFAGGLPAWIQSGEPVPAITVQALNATGTIDVNFSGPVSLALTGGGILSGTLTVNAVNGVAVFDDLVVTGADGAVTFVISSSGLSGDQSAAVGLSTFPVFLPEGSDDWTDAANWTSTAYPDGAGAGARIPAAVSGDRNVNVRAPVTIGELIVDNGSSPFRNRLRDRSTGNTLSFDGGGAGPAILQILGTGTGFVELQNEAGTVLLSDLRLEVGNVLGDPEFGALRLRETWTGPGGLIKAGPGLVSLTGSGKDFSGALLIEQGVVSLTEPATPGQASGVAVQAGGQLRLTSASSESDPVRTYTFGGGLSLGGLGRTGVDEGEGYGILGALRYDPGSQDNRAVVTNPVALTAAAGIHVDGSRNVLELSGALSGTGDLIKTGGGMVILSGNADSLTGSLMIENGSIRIDGAYPVAVSVAEDAKITGTGAAGLISGAGLVLTEGGILTAAGIDGTAVLAVLSGTIAAENGTLRLLDESAGLSPASLDLVVSFPDVVPGTRLRGGILVPAAADLTAYLSASTVRLWLPDESGELIFGGTAYRPAEDADLLTWEPVAVELTLGAETVSGWMIEVIRGGLPRSFAQWRNLEIPDGEGEEDPETGPLGDPTGSGLTNLKRYAFGLGATESPAPRLPRLQKDSGFAYRFAFDPTLEDIAYRVLSSPDLVDWSTVEFDSRLQTELFPVDGWLSLPLNFNGQRFYRLEVILDGGAE